MNTFMIDVSPIVGEAAATLELDEDVPLESITVGDSLVLFAERPHLHAILTNTGEAILVDGTVVGTARLDCSRCLEPFDIVLTGSIKAVVSRPIAEDPPDEQEWYPLEGDRVDLMPAMLSALSMEIPFAPLHDPACLGICPTCGCDLNVEECSCEQAAKPEPDGPFAILKELLPPDER